MKSTFGSNCPADGLPDLYLADHQDRHAVDLRKLDDLARRALVKILDHPGPEAGRIASIDEVEVSFITDEAIARIHGDFLHDPTPTDVITFHHGEILISVDTAARVAVELGINLQRELALYLIHGLLHLNGHEDHSDEGAQRMKSLQEEILVSSLQES